MPSASNALFKYEGGQEPVGMSTLTDSGDRKTFTSTKTKWSKKTGFAPVILPNGIRSGALVTAGSSNDTVDVSQGEINLNGVITTVTAATGLSCARATGAGGADFIIHSVTVNAGGSYAIVSGTESTAFSETRGAAGGPPYIPVDSVEVQQVRYSTTTAAIVTTVELAYKTENVHRESAIYPGYTVNYALGQLDFAIAMPAAHTGDLAKRIYASYAGAVLINSPDAVDFVPPQETATVNSTAIYGGTRGSVSKSLNAGSITIFFNDGITESLAILDGENLWAQFFPDRSLTPYWQGQGVFTINMSYPADSDIQGDITISAETKWERKAA